MKRIFVIGAAGLLLVGCAGQGNDIIAAEVALTAAEKAATIYARLPRCPGPAVCSDQATVDKIKAADNTAYNAVKAAEANPALVSVAVSAVSDFNNLIPKGN